VTRAIDIIIVSHNTRADLMACLASIHDAWPQRVRGVTVVDNASTDNSLSDATNRWPTIAGVALDRNAGFGAANNVALRRSSAEHVLFLNSDTIVPAGAVDSLLARLEARDAVAAGPKLVDANGQPELSFGAMLTPWTEMRQRRLVQAAARGDSRARSRIDELVAAEREVDWVSGACLLARREAVMAAGGFDERFFLYEEDVDLCASLRARGGRILFTPQAQITHLRGRSMQARPSGAARAAYDASHLAFYEKHAPQWTPWLRAWLRLRGRLPRETR
jgi:GT2 family glycosyltransferase